VRPHLIHVALIAAVVLAGAALIYLVNPIECAWLPPCMFHKMTGLNCPGCGMTRATYELLHGHFLAALHLNALFVLALPVTAGVFATRELARRQGHKLKPLFQTPLALWILFSVIILFGIVRNIPVYPFTLLAPP
jgi:hypothetical protein